MVFASVSELKLGRANSENVRHPHRPKREGPRPRTREGRSGCIFRKSIQRTQGPTTTTISQEKLENQAGDFLKREPRYQVQGCINSGGSNRVGGKGGRHLAEKWEKKKKKEHIPFLSQTCAHYNRWFFKCPK